MFINKLPSLSNVVAGSTATLDCPVGLTYDAIQFQYSGVTQAQIENVEVLINGRPVAQFDDAVEVEAINEYYGRSDASGEMTLHFRRPELLEGQRAFPGLGTADVDTLQIRMDINVAASAPVISASAQLSPGAPLGVFVKTRYLALNVSAAGKQELDSIPKGSGRLLAAHLFKADISEVEVEVNSRRVMEGTKDLMESLQTLAGRTPQTAAATHVDFGLYGDLGEALVLSGVRDFRIRPTADTTGTLRVVLEYLDGFEGV